MEKTILISIVIPCYNAKDFLPQLISDIKSQTYPFIETIIVSNGKGQEEQVVLANKLIEGVVEGKVFHTDLGGVSNARNWGIKESHGEWVCFIDADDRIKPNHIETFVNAIDEDYDVVEGGFEQININGMPSNVIFPIKEYDLQLNKDGFYVCKGMEAVDRVGNAPWNKLFKRSFLIENHLKFDERFTMNEDRIFALSAFLCAKKWKFIPMTGYIYKASYGSAMSRYHANVEESWAAYLDLRDKVKLRSGQEITVIDQERVDMQYYLVWQYIWNMFKPGCPFGFGEKVRKIRKMMGDEKFKTSCRRHDWSRESVRYKIFYLYISTDSALLVAFLFASQHYGKQIVNKIKRI